MANPASNVLAAVNIEVSPKEYADTRGETGVLAPFPKEPIRYQQVFSGLSSGMIQEFSLRMPPFAGGGFNLEIDTLQINLSTTSSGPDRLSAVFQENIGPDEAVFIGPKSATISIPRAGDQSPQPWLFFFEREHPFMYDASKGDLLVDIRSSGAKTDYEYSFDTAAQTGDAVSRVYSFDVNAKQGEADSWGFIAEFISVPIPEPSAGSIAMGGAVALAALAAASKNKTHSH